MHNAEKNHTNGDLADGEISFPIETIYFECSSAFPEINSFTYETAARYAKVFFFPESILLSFLLLSSLLNYYQLLLDMGYYGFYAIDFFLSVLLVLLKLNMIHFNFSYKQLWIANGNNPS